ncbi:hypothetical protein AXE80_04645 [Wenyingzhuangia fucanilytica]|uniref:Outer membrane protein beta-barrel domain-containing protein n=1 Tax=Wenyingzhuangia fucanilytica TaxID=1790137 RepID=A0A1B1Y4D7_9FLAO|nr:hypothetical protein [Wenyingzhuangia fucanilytica]ANW95607.1 hypothetical protein AXE80_04645 [Wenyingzhuangia fucanilytica]
MDTFKNLRSIHQFIFTGILLFSFHVSFSQNPVKKATYSLEFINGMSLPMGDFKNFADNGFNSALMINKQFCDKLSIGLNTNYNSLPIKSRYGVSNKKWNSTSINIGPQYNIGGKKFSAGLYGRLGLSFVNIPEINDFYPNTDAVTTNFEKTNTTNLNARVGINIGIKICNGLSFYLASEYSTNLNGDINYGTRDLSKAETPTGDIDPDLASTIPFKNQSFSFSSLNVNFGMRINLNKGNKGTRATDYNSSRSNRSTSIISPDDSNNNNENNGTRATDYNSSRSNRSTSIVSPDDSNNNNENNGTRATDYNSSRSNRSTSIVSPDDSNNDNDDTKATDYNSSRSNKSY